MNIKVFIINFKKALLSPSGIFSFLLWAFLIALLSFYFLDSELVRGNLWAWFLYTEIILSICISLLFGLFMATSIYKFQYFSKAWKKSEVTGWLGWLIWVLVSGCPSCSITLASYVGLAGTISLFPYNGLELKVLSVGLLMYAVYKNLMTLEVCKVKYISKKKFFQKKS